MSVVFTPKKSITIHVCLWRKCGKKNIYKWSKFKIQYFYSNEWTIRWMNEWMSGK